MQLYISKYFVPHCGVKTKFEPFKVEKLPTKMSVSKRERPYLGEFAIAALKMGLILKINYSSALQIIIYCMFTYN